MRDAARNEDRPATLPLPARSPEPSEEFAILVPPSQEPRLIVLGFFKPSPAHLLPPAFGCAQIPVEAEGVLVVTFRSAPYSSLLAGSR